MKVGIDSSTIYTISGLINKLGQQLHWIWKEVLDNKNCNHQLPSHHCFQHSHVKTRNHNNGLKGMMQEEQPRLKPWGYPKGDGSLQWYSPCLRS